MTGLVGATGPLDPDTPSWLAPHLSRRPSESDGGSLLAAGVKRFTTAVVVAVPADDDPVHRVSLHPHVTLAFLGEAAQLTTGDRADVEELVRVLASGVAPFDVTVNGSGVLGDDDQPVLLVEGTELTGVHRLLADEPTIAELTARADQHPNWVPHLSIRDDVTARQVGQVRTVRIAALGVWWAGAKLTAPLTGRERPQPTFTDDEDALHAADHRELLASAPGSVAVPVMADECSLAVGIRRGQEHPEVRLWVVRAAARLGLLHQVPDGWSSGVVLHNNRQTVRLTDGGSEPVTLVQPRRTAADEEDDALRPSGLTLLPGAAEALRRAAFPAAHRPGKVHGRVRR